MFEGQCVGKGTFKVNADHRAVNSHVKSGSTVFVRAVGQSRAGGKQGGTGHHKDQIFHYISRSKSAGIN